MRLLAAVSVLLLVLAACTSTPAASPGGGSPGAASPGGGQPIGDLAAAIPDDVNGVPLQKQTMSGDEAFGDDPSSQSMLDFLQGAGRAASDLTFVVAEATDGTALAVFAFRVAGVEASALQQAIINSGLASNPGSPVTNVTLGGKQVTKVEDTGNGTSSYFYATGDVVFAVDTDQEALAEATLQQLP